MFPVVQRVVYSKNPLIEVVAQLRFPQIMSISVDIPARFQEEIRKKFPIVQTQRAVNFAFSSLVAPVEQTKLFYEFISEDRNYKFTLSDDAISLSASKYSRWEEFFEHLRTGFSAFCKIYEPPYFDRVGLRYVDLINRSALGLQHVLWPDLVRPTLLGALADSELAINQIKSCLTSFLVSGDGYVCAVNCGYPNPDILPTEQKVIASDGDLLIIDMDFYSAAGSTVKTNDAFKELAKYNSQVRNAFHWAIKEQLHYALEPTIP